MARRVDTGKPPRKTSALARRFRKATPTPCGIVRLCESMIASMPSIARQMLVVALLLATVIGLFTAAQVGQLRLEEARTRIEQGTRRHEALSAARRLVREAESSQRGYILLGDSEYLRPFQQAVVDITPALQRLDAAFTGTSASLRADVAQLEHLSDSKFDEMRQSIVLFAMQGKAAAMQVIRTGQGAQTMAEIDALSDKIEGVESTEELDASRRWQSDRWVNFIVTSAALIASASLLLLLSRLMLQQLRFKQRETERLTARQAELEQLVAQRTGELSELSTHLQSVSEQEKAGLARELHDEMGGLLVAARMDLSWLEERLGSNDSEVRAYFQRVQDALQAGVNIKRRVIESLRPTLLDNLGLVPALSWQVSESCARAGLKHAERYPSEELTLNSEASIAVFRIVQEALTNVLKHARATTVEISIEIAPPWLLVRVQDDGVGIPLERVRALRTHGLAAMRHRARALGGQWEVQRPPEGGARIEVHLPLDRVLPEGDSAQLGSAAR
jgi:signal transduction histidine kinase